MSPVWKLQGVFLFIFIFHESQNPLIGGEYKLWIQKAFLFF